MVAFMVLLLTDTPIPTACMTSITASTTTLAYWRIVAQTMSALATSSLDGRNSSPSLVNCTRCLPLSILLISMRNVGMVSAFSISLIRSSGRCFSRRLRMSCSGWEANSWASFTSSSAASLAAVVIASFNFPSAMSLECSSGAFVLICANAPSTASEIFLLSVVIFDQGNFQLLWM